MAGGDGDARGAGDMKRWGPGVRRGGMGWGATGNPIILFALRRAAVRDEVTENVAIDISTWFHRKHFCCFRFDVSAESGGG